jgi:hypothetical protein
MTIKETSSIASPGNSIHVTADPIEGQKVSVSLIETTVNRNPASLRSAKGLATWSLLHVATATADSCGESE